MDADLQTRTTGPHADLNQRHPLYALREFETLYNGHRPHQGIASSRPPHRLPIRFRRSDPVAPVQPQPRPVTVLQKAASPTDRQAADEARENLAWNLNLPSICG